MRKKEGMILLLGILLSVLLGTSYLVAAEQYLYKAYDGQSQQFYKRQDQLQFLKEKIELESLEILEVGVELSGVIYDEKLQVGDIEDKMQQMESSLERHANHSKHYEIEEDNALRSNTYLNNILEDSIEKIGQGYQYTFSLKNQKDIHYNTYYTLKLVGGADVSYIDQLRNKGYEQLQAWHVAPKETIYFKAIIPGVLSEEDTTQIKQQLFHNLEAKTTNFYQDDLVETTYAYYGYTPYIEDYITEADGQKSNVQVGFKYDELKDQTELIIAFPFYNQPF